MELKTNKLAHIQYTRTTNLGGSAGEFTERVIIPTYVPHDAVKAIDVSDLKESDALVLQTQMEEYSKYVEEKMNTIFSFEDWIDHTSQTIPSLKRRTFKLSSLKVVTAE